MVHGDRGAHTALGQPVAFGPLPRERRSAQVALLVVRSQPKQRPSQVAAVVPESLLASRGHRGPSFCVDLAFPGNKRKAGFF